ncbi:hypothetical protein DERP_003588 [Dermatophagoides pteronyssinus]|uniref:Uncharacterized protein n=1 Tax=Dermatophagoides pteronyssinus TaxID=6956 RepID=A0ABQ8JLS8_DERPT|nr:hypothetical protein DERP_003588 [Dermatophagoides pteronyssinus]
MYRKKLKSNLNPQTPTTSKTFRPVIHSNSFNNPVQSTSTTTKQDFDFSLNDSTFSIRSRITNNLNSTTITTTPATTNEKRKSLFSDFDLSDIKLDDSFKSFTNGRQCTKPSEIHYKRTRSLFLDIEELLLKEICGYRKIQQQQQQQEKL